MTDLKVKGTGLDVPPSPPGAKSEAARAEESSFAGNLKEARRNLVDGDLKKILDDVRALGERFFRSPTEETLGNYKKRMQQFLDRVSKEMFSLRQESGSPKDGQQKVYQLVETVNSEIDSLTRDTLQKDRSLKLLASLDDIRGMVLDLII